MTTQASQPNVKRHAGDREQPIKRQMIHLKKNLSLQLIQNGYTIFERENFYGSFLILQKF